MKALGDVSTRHKALAVGLVAAAAFVAHAPSLRAGYILDDDTLLASNPYVRSWAGLKVLLTQEFFLASARPEGSAQYRPVSGLLNWVTWQLFGASPVWQHGFNIGLHAAVAILLLAAFCSLGVRLWPAVFAAALFAVHPVTAMNVSYVEGRQDLFAWVILLAAMTAVCRGGLARVACVAFAATLAATHCREAFAGAFLPIAAFAGAREDRPRRSAVISLGAGGLALLATLALRHVLDLGAYPSPPWTVAALVEGSAAAELRLLRDVVLPIDLAIFVTPTKLGLAAAALVHTVSAVVILGIDRLAAARARCRALVWAGVLVVETNAAVYSLVVVRDDPLSDRYAYGFVLAAVLIVSGLACAHRVSLPSVRRVGSVLAPLLVVALMPLTWARAATFRDERALQDAMAEERPDDPEVEIAAGLRLFHEGDVDGAYPHCAAYAKAKGTNGRAAQCLAAWLARHGRSCDAFALMRPFALARPGYPAVRRMAFATAFACPDYEGVRDLLSRWAPWFPSAPDVVEAEAELARRGQSPSRP